MKRWVAIPVWLMMSGSVTAQTAVERIEPRLARAIQEHKVFLTCTSLDANV